MAAVNTLDEEQLVRRVARGDQRAFDELYRRTAPWLAVRLRRRCADDDLVAEVMQETYLAVWRAAAAFAGASVRGARAAGCGRSLPAAWSTRFAAGPGARRVDCPGDCGAARHAGGNRQDPRPAGPDRIAGRPVG